MNLLTILISTLRVVSVLARPIYSTPVHVSTGPILSRRSESTDESYDQWYQSLSERRHKLNMASKEIQAKQHKESANRIKHSTSQNFDLEYEPDWLDGLVIQTKGMKVGKHSYKVPHNRGIDARRGVPNKQIFDAINEPEDDANYFWDPNCPRYNQTAQDKIPNYPRPGVIDPPTRSPARGDVEANNKNDNGRTGQRGSSDDRGKKGTKPVQFSSDAGLSFRASSNSLFIAVVYLICLL
ncbi:hypothetical protein B0I72DRAFT_133890 [Yarrowia lipolytica]|jgi:hypothetical protein|uniref:YALI0B18084p n=2 Tax=Yarrowia lipolytica TaxID=4952 RepID=Q6CE70_YARLI|nr:YALI0B18084p [Yarrowia lipolytica CLIB122]AOW01865.1 hypothetical protein YALI1_B23385g [Yarrowia lipolytica]KAB8280814.1 hypothetical protein BKA91DRAFT_141327 [Yarrowia lipolytica]KAE8170054.1 hypothetical protein BKA90DRAFT_141565 [Yarrowia lipolytica]KAJ8052656.1 hypothetical protein LXG23DRAFT_24303 [Yarrowia lipolytica]RDW24364.1 hypothetical protein B0I71DRAFT_134398 [Yarrowia lipolytica]|eukprot:XP_501042.1 YALI0B18084p [Yarrowia lipolytica CLIB122]